MYRRLCFLIITVMYLPLTNAGDLILNNLSLYSSNDKTLIHQRSLKIVEQKIDKIGKHSLTSVNPNDIVIDMAGKVAIGAYFSVGQQASFTIIAPTANLASPTDYTVKHRLIDGEFSYLGDNSALPFVDARKSDGLLWLSGQIGNLPSTKTLIGPSVIAQTHQTMKNIGYILKRYHLNYQHIIKCTLMLDDISDWHQVSNIYRQYFKQLPARSAFATNGLALGAKVEIECIAQLQQEQRK